MAEKVQAKDIGDMSFIRSVYLLGSMNGNPSRWVMRWDVASEFPDFPEKVVYAKFYQLKKRGLLDGCECGCRGDYRLTDKGMEMLAIDTYGPRPADAQGENPR